MNRIRCLAALSFGLFSLAAGAFIIPPPPPYASEYVNDLTGHYVLISDPAEKVAVEGGAAGPGWRRTGYSFQVRDPGTQVVDGNVCRFYAPSVNSHFHTGFAAECNYLRENATGWIFEKFAFSAPLAHGNCELMMTAVHRLYNNRHPVGDPNHRYTADAEVRAEMLGRGWIDEGIAFCTPSAFRAPAKSFTIVSGKLAPTAECEDEGINLGSCTALNQLPRMPNSVTDTLPPFWVTPNPAYPLGAQSVTGVGMGAHLIETARPIAFQNEVVLHSFLQTNGSSSWFGIHVNSFDRTHGDYSSINPLYQFVTRAPAAGAPDQRVFPWGDGRDHELDVSFNLVVNRLLRADPRSHAYGHPTLQFIDRTSGEHLYVTLGAFGSMPVDGEDYLARDVVTRRVIVSTTFRTDPSFGKRISGEWITCPGSGPCNPTATDFFKFRIDRAAFQRILDRARTLSVTLSADPADYHLANFHFNNEVYGDGDIGLRLSNYTLSIYDR
jgi:hypothetical protein